MKIIKLFVENFKNGWGGAGGALGEGFLDYWIFLI
jgi:hypothetical protein